MSVKPDRWIRKMALEHKMIEPFTDRQVREGVISYGVSSYGYDIRVADEFQIFTNVNSTIVDPKHFEREGVRGHDADVAFVRNERTRIEMFWIDDGRIDVGENLKFIGDTNVVAVRRNCVADD